MIVECDKRWNKYIKNKVYDLFQRGAMMKMFKEVKRNEMC